MPIGENLMGITTEDIDTIRFNHADLTDRDGTPARRQCNAMLRNQLVLRTDCRKSQEDEDTNNRHTLTRSVSEVRRTTGELRAAMMAELTEKRYKKVHITRVECPICAGQAFPFPQFQTGEKCAQYAYGQPLFVSKSAQAWHLFQMWARTSGHFPRDLTPSLSAERSMQR